MYTKKDMEQMLYGLLEDLVSKEQPKIIEESKEEPLTEYQKELLQSISEEEKKRKREKNTRVIARLDIPPTAIERIFGKSTNLAERIKVLASFVRNEPPKGSSPERLLWYMNILFNLAKYIKQHKNEPSSLGFEMEHFLAALVGGIVIPANEGNKSDEIDTPDGKKKKVGDVTDVVVGDTSYSLKTISEGTNISGSILNLQNSLQKYTNLYYIIFLKKGDGTDIEFYSFPLKEGSINKENIESLGLVVKEDGSLIKEPLKNPVTQFKAKLAGITKIDNISVREIEKAAKNVSNEFVVKNKETEKEIVAARNQVKQFQKHLMKNPKEGQNNLNNAMEHMKTATTHIQDIISIKYGTPDTEQGNNQQ